MKLFLAIVILMMAFWVLMFIFAMSPKVAHAGTLRLSWTWPCARDTVGCHPDSITLGPPLNNLDHGTLWGVRCHDLTDTLRIGDLDATGLECQRDSMDVDIADGSVGWVWLTATDHEGDESCVGSWLTFAFPASSFGGAPPGPGLTASLFQNTELVGDPEATRTDSTVNYSWGDGPAWAGGPSDGFSIRWQGFVEIPAAGTWRFYVSSDDGRRLFIDGVSVIDFWAQTWSEGTWAGSLTAGRHPIRLDYFEGSGGALVSLSWAGPDGVRQVIPASALSH